MIQVTTDRLIIRDHIEEDLIPMHELFSNKNVMYFLPGIKKNSLEETKQSLQIAITEASSNSRSKYFFAMINKNTKEYIGEIGFTKKSEYKLGNVMDLGFFIKEDYWGKGITTEASKAIMNYAFNNLNTIKIEAGCIVDNVGSQRVMKKLGMIKEAEFKNHILIDNKFYDRVEYRLLKEEWKKRKVFILETD